MATNTKGAHMAVTVALLQGVNVGKYKRISMADFKALIADLGGRDAVTVANSGNIVFTHDQTDEAKLCAAIEKAVTEHVGVEIPTVTRTAAEMQQIVAANPYPEVTDTKCLHVDFLANETPDVLEDIEFGEDHLTVIGREIYMHLPNKISGTTHDGKTIQKRLGTRHTSRNWNTVTKLAQIAADLESAL